MIKTGSGVLVAVSTVALLVNGCGNSNSTTSKNKNTTSTNVTTTAAKTPPRTPYGTLQTDGLRKCGARSS